MAQERPRQPANDDLDEDDNGESGDEDADDNESGTSEGAHEDGNLDWHVVDNTGVDAHSRTRR